MTPLFLLQATDPVPVSQFFGQVFYSMFPTPVVAGSAILVAFGIAMLAHRLPLSSVFAVSLVLSWGIWTFIPSFSAVFFLLVAVSGGALGAALLKVWQGG